MAGSLSVNSLRNSLINTANTLADGYAWVLLLPSRRAGFALLLLSFMVPLLGSAGIIGAVVALAVGRWLKAELSAQPVYVFNGLLIGMFVASQQPFGVMLLLLLPLAATLSALLVACWAPPLWRFARLPLLTLPFVVSAWLMHLAIGGLSLPPEWPGSLTEQFAGSLSAIFFQHDWRVGLIYLAVILVVSRTLVLLALLGFGVGLLWQAGLTGQWLSAGALFNPILAAVAAGGLFVAPGRAALLLGLLAALFAAFLESALAQLLGLVGLTPLSLPFVLATWLALFAALRSGQPSLAGDHIQSPEQSMEELGLRRARLGEAQSVGLVVPFLGEWQISQGFYGRHTHCGVWCHALDFIVTVEGRSFKDEGRQASDYFCFGLPITSPCYGEVVAVENSVADNPPGEVNLNQNWGNYL